MKTKPKKARPPLATGSVAVPASNESQTAQPQTSSAPKVLLVDDEPGPFARLAQVEAELASLRQGNAQLQADFEQCVEDRNDLRRLLADHEDGMPSIPASVRAWLAKHLEHAETEVRLGPGSMGWKNNEAKRPAIEELAAFLRALLA